MRTNEDGRFRISISKKEHRRGHHDFWIFDERYVPVCHPAIYFREDANDEVRLPVSRLFDAGKVSFIVADEIDRGLRSSYVGWKVDHHDGPVWMGEWFDYRSLKPVRFPSRMQLRSNQKYTISVPAGLKLQLFFEGGDEDLRVPVCTDRLTLQSGQSIDVGRIDIRKRMPIFVQLVDSGGKTVSGVGVKHLTADGHRYFGQTHVTDEQGIAEFLVPPRYEGRFCVGYQDEDREFVSEWVTYETQGPGDANSVFTLKVSDAMLEVLYE